MEVVDAIVATPGVPSWTLDTSASLAHLIGSARCIAVAASGPVVLEVEAAGTAAPVPLSTGICAVPTVIVVIDY